MIQIIEDSKIPALKESISKTKKMSRTSRNSKETGLDSSIITLHSQIRITYLILWLLNTLDLLLVSNNIDQWEC